MHDLDKCFTILIFGDAIATKIHRSIAGHHKIQNTTYKERVEMFIDWECARFTKPEKQLTGEETWIAFYENLDMLDIVNQFKQGVIK